MATAAAHQPAVTPAASGAPARRPNVLFITTDQQRFDTLGVTGNPYVRTPNLDALSARGTLFSRGFIQNPVCMPSRACLMTGRYVHQHGVEYMESEIGTTPGLPPWETPIMERLQRQGYTTAAYGKIHMLPPRGLDETGLTMGKGARWTVARGSPLGPSQLGPVYEAWLEAKRPGAYESIYAQRRLPEYRDQASAIVNTLAAGEYVDYWIGENTWKFLERPDVGTPERPFFAWCGFCGPHTPFDPPEPYASMYDQSTIPISPLLHARQQNIPGEAERRSRFDREDGEPLARKITAYYWGMVSLIDAMLGRIMDVLTRRGLWENTLVIFTTDHGEMLGDFGRLGKGNFTEPVIRAPYIVVPPGSVAPPAASGTSGTSGLFGTTDTSSTSGLPGVSGTSSTSIVPGISGQPVRILDALVEHIDLVPTILDYAGMDQPAEIVGTSLRPLLEGTPGAAGKDAVLCEYVSNDRQLRQKCLRTSRYKFVFSGAARPVEFYDLEKDPLEQVNVAADPTYRDEVERHARLLLDRLLQTEQTPWNAGGAAAAAPAALDHFGRP